MDYQKLLFGLGLTLVSSFAFHIIRKKYKDDVDLYENLSRTPGKEDYSYFRYAEIGNLTIMIIVMLAGIWISYNAIAEYFNWNMLPVIW